MTSLHARLGALSALLLALVCGVGAGHAQEPDGNDVRARSRIVEAPPDSAGAVEQAREAQEQLEQFRESRIPPELRSGGGRCDEMIGRMCFRFERDDTPIQPEPLDLEMARRDLLETLVRVHRSIPGDGWVLGQLVFYLGESGRWTNALEFAEGCVATPWWCAALRGYALHELGRTGESAAAFAEALRGMSPEEAARWASLEFLLDPSGTDAANGLSDAELARARDYLWLLADPLYLVPDNDRLTAHYARRVVVLIREEAANAFGLEWEADLEQLVIRYGPEVGWERGKGPPTGGGSLADTRHIIGRHHPKSAQFVPPEGLFVRPAEIPADTWEIEKDRPRTGYAAPYALDVDALDAQVARFRRGDSLLVVSSYAPKQMRPVTRVAERRAGRSGRAGATRTDPFGNPVNDAPPSEDPFGFGTPSREGAEDDGDALQSALFLVTPAGRTAAKIDGSANREILTAQVPNGDYVVSMEVWDPAQKKAWRARHGVSQPTIPPDLAAVSDLLVTEGEGELPESWEEAVPRTLPGVRVVPGDRVHLAWEVYGLELGERASVTMGLTQGKPNLLRRVGQFLRILEPEVPVVVSFEDAGADALGTIFRSVRLDFPEELEPGEYTLHVEIELPGRSAMVISRRVLVETPR